MTFLLDRARELADDVLYPAAAEVDASGVIPPSHFAALAEAGLYGVAVDDPAALPAVTEVLAEACLATAFTWMQHHGPVRTLAATSRAALRERWLDAAVAGRVRCGVALAGGLPDPPLLWATREPGGWRLDGLAPLVTGWGLIDLVQIAARDVATADAPDDSAVIVTALLDARPAPGLTVRALALLAADASRTVQVRFDGLLLPDDRVTGLPTRTAFLAGATVASRVNGALALGVAGRCIRLIAESGRAAAVAERLGAELDAVRDALDSALDSALAAASGPPAAAPDVGAAPSDAAAPHPAPHPAGAPHPGGARTLQQGHLPAAESQQGHLPATPHRAPHPAPHVGAAPSDAAAPHPRDARTLQQGHLPAAESQQGHLPATPHIAPHPAPHIAPHAAPHVGAAPSDAAAPHPRDARALQQGHLPAAESQEGDPAALPEAMAARMAAARATASELAHRAAGALVVAAGSRAVLDGHPAGRMLREAALTFVAAGRDEIRAELLAHLSRS